LGIGYWVLGNKKIWNSGHGEKLVWDCVEGLDID